MKTFPYEAKERLRTEVYRRGGGALRAFVWDRKLLYTQIIFGCHGCSCQNTFFDSLYFSLYILVGIFGMSRITLSLAHLWLRTQLHSYHKLQMKQKSNFLRVCDRRNRSLERNMNSGMMWYNSFYNSYTLTKLLWM